MTFSRRGATSFLAILLLTSSVLAKDKNAAQVLPDSRNAKPGSLADISSIGTRNVGCGRGVGNWYNLEKQISMGKEFAKQVESSSKLIRDPVVLEYVNRVAQNLVRNSDARVPFTIKVVDSDEINAFALPGGFFYINSGLILAADNEAELAGVMSHEIAHVAACHAAREATRGQLANLASLPLIFVGGGVGYAIANAAGFALPLTFLKFARGFEAQADFLGLEYLYKSGYDPEEFISFFEKVQALDKQKPGILAKTFSTHPQTPDRIARSQQLIQRLLPARSEYVEDTSDFQQVKSRLAALENSRVPGFNEDRNRPALRRRGPERTDSDTSGASTNGTAKDDGDRPTLKRRPEQ